MSERGWEALRLAVQGAHRVFSQQSRYDVRYVVCLNSVPVDVGRALLGPLADCVEWLAVSRDDVPAALRAHFDDDMAEGVAWKLAPPRVCPDRWEIAMDNDCILWEMPAGMHSWLEAGDPRQCLLAEDAVALFGQFASACGPEARNAGIRGVPPGFPLDEVLTRLADGATDTLSSELDEQGLQVAAASAFVPPAVCSLEDVTICSPFPPHRASLGRCGAHFVGLNARHFAWQLDGRYAEEHIRENWERLRPALYARILAHDVPPWLEPGGNQ